MIMTTRHSILISSRGLLLIVCAISVCIGDRRSAIGAGNSSACSVEPVDSRGAFTFSWAQVFEGDAFLSLRNNGATKQAVAVGLTEVTKPKPGSPLEALSIEPAPGVTKDKHGKFTVPPHGSILFYLKEAGIPPSPVPPSGNYVTQLLLGPPCAGPPTKPTSITITVGKVQPVVQKLSLLVLRAWPWSNSWTTDVQAPIRHGTFLPDLSKRAVPVGVLQRESGGLATVTWIGTIKGALGRYPEATLSINDLSGAGSYSGSIVLADERQGYDGKASNPFELTVLVKDHWYWPAAMIFFSVLIAFVVKRYLGVQRLIWNMGLEEASIGKEYQQAERKFGAATAGKEYGKYSIHDDLDKQRRIILDDISKVQKAWGITSIEGNQDYKDASDRLLALHHQLTAWGDFGDELAKLADSLNSVLNTGHNNLAGAPEVARAETLLAGKPISMAQIDSLSKEVIQATQDLDGLLANETGTAGPSLSKALFGFGLPVENKHSKSSPKVADKRRAAFLARAIREGDVAVAIFAVIIAELIGLNTKYLGFRAFGTFKDYVDLFVWGAATKATLDIITVLLDKVSGAFYRQLPPP
jgi:hypothetical protein